MGNKTRPTAVTISETSTPFPSDSQMSGPNFWLVFPGKRLSCAVVIPRSSVTSQDAHQRLSIWKQAKCISFPKQLTNQSSQAEVPKWDISGNKRNATGVFILCSWLSLLQTADCYQWVGLNKKLAVKKHKILQHFGFYAMHALHKDSFHHWQKQLIN